METQANHNTPLSEIDDLRQQLALFKQRLDQQEIIKDRMMRRSMHARFSPFTKVSVISDFIVLLISPIIFVALNKAGFPWYFGAIVVLMTFIELIYNITVHRQVQRLFNDGNDLLTVRRGLLSFKRKERMWMLIAVPFVFLWLLAFYWKVGLFSSELAGTSAAGFFCSFIGIFLGLLIGGGFFAWEIHRVNRSIREIDELSAN